MTTINHHLLYAVLALVVSVLASDVVAQSTEGYQQEERKAYNQALKAGTAEAWDIFINNYPNSPNLEQARMLRDHAVVNQYCNPSATLERLVAYIDNNEAHQPRIKTFYANLVNNPTHSYRIEHLDVGFNGCTGRVKETVTLANGKQCHNQFVFNQQGLLTKSSIQNAKGQTTVVNYSYSYDNLHGYALKQSQSKHVTIQYAPIYGQDDRIEALKGNTGCRQDYTYGDNGTLTKLVITAPKTPKRTLLYKDGYVIREEKEGRAYRYFYDYDAATGKKFLIAIKEMKDGTALHERTFKYTIDTHGRYTRVEVALDGKRQMVITRTYTAD